MKDIIQLLPDSVANQIAAGEVVQRPASVVKELMENAIDAGATKVHVVVSDGGRTLIQVIDNGKGMSETDARLAFERHATSKIRCADDLFALSTMGFRGEALASIVAVSQVELVTRRESDDLGTLITISGSQFEQQEPVSAPVGSNFKVKNLFFNVPARRKFLKSNQTEFSNILTEFERIALINSDVEFSLSHNGSELLSLPASTFRQRIVALFGKKINSQLIEVEVNSTLINVKGFVGTPESARKKGVPQFFFVNGRYMRHPYFAKAVSGAYEDIIPQGEQVPFFLCIDVEPSRIDVNIHPTKTEIKFEDESSLWKIISASVRESLGRFNAVPSLEFDDEAFPDIPAMDINTGGNIPVSAPRVSYTPGYNPFKSNGVSSNNSNTSWEMMYGGVEGEKPLDLSPFEDIPDFGFADSVSDSQPSSDVLFDGFLPDESVPLLQYKGQYILVPVKSGLMWIHQRRAHIRVLFDKYCSQINGASVPSQGLLFPERLDLSVSESVVFDNITEELVALGFDISSLGGGSYAINGVPPGIDGLSPVKLLMELLHGVSEQTREAKGGVVERIALSMAKQVAVVVGQILTNEEMNRLVAELFASSLPVRTPDGDVVLYTMSDTEIAKFFAK